MIPGDTVLLMSDPVAHVSFKMPRSLVEELRLVAKENDRTLSNQARIALREWLAANAKEEAA